MDNSVPRNKAIENARASVNMEGYEVTPLMDELCRQVLDGRITLSDSIKVFRHSRVREE